MCLVQLVRDGKTRLILAVTMRTPAQIAYQQQTMEDSRGKAAKVAQEL